MKHLLTIISCFAVLSMSAQMTHVSYEVDTVFTQPTTEWNVDLQGYVVYDVFAHFTNPSDELSAIFSDATALDTSPFYVDAPCGCFNPELGDVLLGGEQNPALFEIFPEIAFDTYWTIGFAGNEQTVFFNANYNSTSMCSEEESNGVIFTIMPQSADEDLKIQIAQITTCGDFELNACFQVFINGIQSPSQQFCMDVDGSGPLVVIADVEGCTDPTSCNYDSNAVDDDGSCTPNSLGCMDPTACNFLDTATCDSGECIESGCMDELACNYNPDAGCSDESCLYAGPLGCGPGTVWDEETLRCIVDENVCDDGTYWDASTSSCKPIETCEDDLDGDGLVGVNDLMQLLSSYGMDCPLVEPAEWTCGDPVSYHGYNYESVLIGEQCWFAENLRTELYQNGDSIPRAESALDWIDFSDASIGGFATYGSFNDVDCADVSPQINSCDPLESIAYYGLYYNFHTVSDERLLCPSGWSIGDANEWADLFSFTQTSTGSGYWSRHLRAEGSWYVSFDWNQGTNSTGFTAHPGGAISLQGMNNGAGANSWWWTSSPSLNGEEGVSSYIFQNSMNAEIWDYSMGNGFPIRCVKD